jgi:hypothetical protein
MLQEKLRHPKLALHGLAQSNSASLLFENPMCTQAQELGGLDICLYFYFSLVME